MSLVMKQVLVRLNLFQSLQQRRKLTLKWRLQKQHRNPRENGRNLAQNWGMGITKSACHCGVLRL